MSPLVSVLMTSYNREKYIGEAIESVLASTYSNFELIIVDDRSTDKTIAIAKSYQEKDSRIQVFINKENLGDYPNRNKASKHAKGKYLKYLDSDDFIYPHGLEVMVNSMETFPQACIGFSNKLSNWSILLPALVTSIEAYREHFFRGGFLSNGPTGTIYKTEYFNKIGKFEPSYGVATDVHFNLKAAFYYPVVVFNRDLFWWRKHEMQEINLKQDLYESLNYAINASFLERPDCPLPMEERKVALKNMRNIYTRKVLKCAFNLNAKAMIEKYKRYNLTVEDLVLSTLPSTWRRKLQ